MKASELTTELRGSSARHEVDVASRVTMTLAEAAEVLGIHRTTAWSLHERGSSRCPYSRLAPTCASLGPIFKSSWTRVNRWPRDRSEARQFRFRVNAAAFWAGLAMVD